MFIPKDKVLLVAIFVALGLLFLFKKKISDE
jgi:hypothetical protein